MNVQYNESVSLLLILLTFTNSVLNPYEKLILLVFFFEVWCGIYLSRPINLFSYKLKQ